MTLKARYKVRVQWADCDIARVVFYPNYFRMFDSATHHLMEQAGKPIPMMIRNDGIMGLPIVDAHAAVVQQREDIGPGLRHLIFHGVRRAAVRRRADLAGGKQPARGGVDFERLAITLAESLYDGVGVVASVYGVLPLQAPRTAMLTEAPQ